MTVLTTENGLEMARKYNNFVHEISERLKAGTTVDEVMQKGKHLFSDDSNYLRHTSRKTGQIYRLKSFLPQQTRFKAPVDVKTYDGDGLPKRILRSILDLINESDPPFSNSDDDEGIFTQLSDDEKLELINKHGFTAKEILAKYNDTYQEENHTIKWGALNKELTYLKNLAKLEKTDEGSWRAKNLKVLTQECS